MLILQNKHIYITTSFVCYMTEMALERYLEFLPRNGLMLKYQFTQP